MADILLITGLSGAGRSQAADDLEDLGWFVVDNMPLELIEKVVELAGSSAAYRTHLALVLGLPSHQEGALDVGRSLRSAGHRVRSLFLDASTAELVRRYGATRRKHPLDDGRGGVEDAVNRERSMLEPVKGAADMVIDTTAMTVHQLKSRIAEFFAVAGSPEGMRIAVVSFGFKHGIPLDVDLVFDVRFLPNPHWDERLRPMTGLDDEVADRVLEGGLARTFLDRLESMFEVLLPAYRDEGRSYLSVAIGCTGGRHRSVAVAERFASWLSTQGHDPRVTHRDLDR
ncbi:MAG: RNase adapter RapZ [Actinobacteria bacterium]|nr:RNase adapter RapZ [Actinomycetota bacterium]